VTLFAANASAIARRRAGEMEEIRKILREAMPKIIASLAVAFVTGWVAFFWQKE